MPGILSSPSYDESSRRHRIASTHQSPRPFSASRGERKTSPVVRLSFALPSRQAWAPSSWSSTRETVLASA